MISRLSNNTNLDLTTTLIFLIGSLSGLPDAHTRAMFSEYRIYSGEIMLALACDGTLFLKTTQILFIYLIDTETKAYPGSKNRAPANPDWLEDREKMAEIMLDIEYIPVVKTKNSYNGDLYRSLAHLALSFGSTIGV